MWRADRPLGGRLVLLTNVFILAGLSFGLDWADPRPPGEGEGGDGTGKYCPKCGFELQLDGKILFCVADGAIDASKALNSPRLPGS